MTQQQCVAVLYPYQVVACGGILKGATVLRLGGKRQAQGKGARKKARDAPRSQITDPRNVSCDAPHDRAP